jgi:hypothetical protein
LEIIGGEGAEGASGYEGKEDLQGVIEARGWAAGRPVVFSVGNTVVDCCPRHFLQHMNVNQ